MSVSPAQNFKTTTSPRHAYFNPEPQDLSLKLDAITLETGNTVLELI